MVSFFIFYERVKRRKLKFKSTNLKVERYWNHETSGLKVCKVETTPKSNKIRHCEGGTTEAIF
ncbi:MAG: hypothetical protein DRJ01_09990 [Bacteroidetes bacterium]|nr:MAG: hypothetical protein DRJ01_09990 [Bacteroidota bacterium]